MKAIVVGHGWYNNTTEMLKVPDGVYINFYTDENAPLIIANSLAMLARGDLGIPLDTKSPGENVANYDCETFTDEQRAWVLALNRTDPVAIPLYFVGSDGIASPGKFCTAYGTCPEKGPHSCDGILGLVARKSITELDVLNCRINTDQRAPATRALIGTTGDRDTSVLDEQRDWIFYFIGLGPAEQDEAWRGLPYATQVYMVSDAEMNEWAQCYETRQQLAQTNDPNQISQILNQLPPVVRARLLRDYPDVRQRAVSTITLDPGEKDWIEQDFLQRDFDAQRNTPFPDQQRIHFLAHDGFAAWTQANNAYDLFTMNLDAPNLVAHIARLPPGAKAILAQQPDLANYLINYPGWAG